MATKSNLEAERRFEVSDNASLPLLVDLPGVRRVDKPEERQLDAFYFDTEDLSLIARGVTLQRRVTGDGARWHLDMPSSGAYFLERDAEPGDESAVPRDLLDPVLVHVRDRTLLPVAHLITRQVMHRLIGDSGDVLAEIGDNHVTAKSLRSNALEQDWREWEVELVNAPTELLDAAEELVRKTGARPTAAASNLARVLSVDSRSVLGAGRKLPKVKMTAGELALGYLRQQVDALKSADPAVRADAEGAVHRMRRTTRRLRSALSTYRSLFERETADQLREDLRWLAGSLGTSRDAEVLRRRIAIELAAEPADLVVGPVAERIDEELGETYRNAHRDVLETLRSQRYFRLLDDLDRFLAHPHLAKAAGKPAGEVVPRLVEREFDRMRKAVKPALSQQEGAEHDAILHEARKRAKGLRYAAEPAGRVLRSRARNAVKVGRRIQEVLGDYQESVITRSRILELSAHAHENGESTLTLGRIHALEQVSAGQSEKQFRSEWKRMRNVHSRSWRAR